MTYALTRPKSVRFSAVNVTTLIFRTKHARDEYGYRGFNLTYQSNSNRRVEIKNASFQSQDSPHILEKIFLIIDLRDLRADKPFPRRMAPSNSTKRSPLLWIVWSSSKSTMVKTLTFASTHSTGIIEKIVWRSVFIIIQIDLESFISQVERICNSLASLTRIRSLSDIVPGSWFVANDSQLWIRFSSSEFSMGMSSFRLFFSETIQCSPSNSSLSVCSDIDLFLSL